MLGNPVIQGHDPALTVPGMEAVSLKLLPLGFCDQVAFYPHQGIIGRAGLGANPSPELLSCDGAGTGVRADSWQVLSVDHGTFATASESYTIG